MTRREFVNGLGAAGALCALPSLAADSPEDWKAAFAEIGFDPDAPGSSTFIVVGDPHVPWGDTVKGVKAQGSQHLPDRIAQWNAMRPRPLAVLSAGDQISTVTVYMGDRDSIGHPHNRARAEKDIKLFRSYFDKLEVPLIHTTGNHDAYPGEVNGAFYAANYPGWKPYGRYDLGGATLINLCGGHDGYIEPVQRAWLREEAKTIPNDRALFLMAHYPDVGVGRVDGYDIGVVIREFFSGRAADTWLLAGHNHEDAIRRFSLPGDGRLYVATHVREPFGYWIYGLRNGLLVGRVLVPYERSANPVRREKPRCGRMAADIRDQGYLYLPFEAEGDKLLWRHFVGHPGDEKYRVSTAKKGDAGSYFFYLGNTIYRLPLAEAKDAARVGLFAAMRGKNNTHEPEKLFLSNDGQTWTPVENPWANYSHTCYSIDIPPALRGGEWLYVRIDAFGMCCNSSLAGFALLK